MITVSDAASLLNCSERTVREWCAREGIGQRFGRAWMLSEADVERLRLVVRDRPGRPPVKPVGGPDSPTS